MRILKYLFWIMTPCRLIYKEHTASISNSALKMEAVSSCEILVITNQTTQCHTSVDNTLNLYCFKSHNSYIIFLL